MATAPSPNDLTRQQLDELDALLQRMLSVPLPPADTPMPVSAPVLPTPPAPPNWRVDPPAPAVVGPAPHLLFAEPPPAPPAPKVEAPPPAPVPAKPQAAPASTPQATPTVAKKAPQPVAPVPIAPVPAAPPVPLLFLPFVALNAVFDTVCGLFGPPGRLLRSGFFKYLYGLAGLGLLVYTAAYVAQAQGWLSLPVALPWPR